MSMFVLIKRLDADGKEYYFNRLKHVMLQYLCWTSVWTVYTWSNQEHQFYNLKYVITFIVRGGFSLFWFFFSLIFLTILAYVVHKWSKGFIWALLFFSILMIVISNLLARSNPKFSWLTAYFNQMNFTPYVFIAVLMGRSGLQWTNNKKLLALLSVAFVLTSMVNCLGLPHENNFSHNAMAIPPYTRISLIVGSVFACCFIFFGLAGSFKAD